MPFRNLLRAPRRGLLTLLGVASIITVLVGVVGMVDSFIATIDRGEQEILGDSPDRLEIDLDDIYPVDSEQVAAVLGATTLTDQEAGLRLVGTLSNGDEEIDAFIQLVDLDSALWRPTAVRGSLGSDAPGLVIAKEAAKDLGVDVGDTVTLRHPSSRGSFESTVLPVIAVHPDPLRVNVYMDVDHAGLMGLEGTTNVIHARPAPGQSVDAVKRETFELPGVASVQGVAANAAIVRELMEQWVGILRVAEVAVLGLALLIAFNTASISADERAREYATMFAYGVPVRTVMRVAVIESAVVGALRRGRRARRRLSDAQVDRRHRVAAGAAGPRRAPGVRAGEPGSRSWAWRARGGGGAAADRSQAAKDGRAVHPSRNGVAQPAVWASAMAPSTPDRAPSAGVTMYSSMASDTSGART